MESINEEGEENPVFPVDLSIFKEQIEQNLLNILDLMPKQEKTLILEKSLISKLNFFTKLEPLKQRMVQEKITIFSKSPPTENTPISLYIIPSKKEFVEIIQSHIEDNINKTSLISYLVKKVEEKKDEEKKKRFPYNFCSKNNK